MFPPLFYRADNQDLADRVCATAWSFLQMLEVFVVTHRLFCGFNTEQKTEKIQESRAVAGNHRAMQGTCIESLNLIPAQRSEQKEH